jgi:hypothetical protein
MVQQQAKTMSDNEVVLRLFTVALLVAFLIYKRAKRAARRATFLQQFQRPGVGLDTAPLRPRLAVVRWDFARAAQAHAAGLRARQAWLAAARLRLEQLPFFGPPAESTGRAE